VNVNILASTSVPFTLMTVQVPNLALTHTKRITGWGCGPIHLLRDWFRDVMDVMQLMVLRYRL
jgi:hypothetical protein